ncbi:hypothetical protein AQI95_30615 [Streptomyces yokosukanensis]|uniref:Uncharacterized protein n=1 Tax=Streptomyces yokosukanensis TaxID=67386 RepID=A0A101NXX9_9ACTN|nr:hypothetical protein [Streptomyces yokosukanensis]KUN01295.1 hypothetical protein AQI95_30615 [Streptomyces yokosukanensis]
MWGASRADAVGEFQDRIEAAVAGSSYRMRRTGQGFDLVVDVHGRERREHTYRVALRPSEKAFTMADIVRGTTYDADPGRIRVGRSVSSGRSLYVVTSRNPDGTRYRFSSADGHRLIRGVARELGWRELMPTSVKVAIGFGIFGGLVGIGVLVGLAIAFWL